MAHSEAGDGASVRRVDMTTIGTDVITIKLDGVDKQFTIHKDLLCYRSKFFKAALTGGFLEANTDTFLVKDTTEKTLRQFMQWVYRGIASMDLGTDDLVNLYLFADFYDVPELRGSTLGDCDWEHRAPDPEIVHKACERLPENSELVEHLVMMCVKWWVPGSLEEHEDLYPRRFVWRVMEKSIMVIHRERHQEGDRRWAAAFDALDPETDPTLGGFL